jgi:Fe-S cluster biosynthesis and repair protein YggX
MRSTPEIIIATFFLFVIVVFTIEFGKPSHKSLRSRGDDVLEDVVSGQGSGAHDNFHVMPDFENPPTLEQSDLIYNLARNTVPIVIEEYNLIFFLVAKAASSEWLRFFLRLEGNHRWCSNENIHDNEQNGLKYLSHYPIEKAQEMMTSPKWTRAIFVRNPKPRILSAFLDKAVAHSKHFVASNCATFAGTGGNHTYCIEHHTEFEFFLYNITTRLGKNVHWRSIYSRVDEKWWPWINYVANMEHLSEDAEHFLRTIKSKVDGVSAWDRIGKTGWSSDERHCDSLGNSSFLAMKDTRHKTNALDHMREYYTPKLERFVEVHYADDFNNPFFKFSDIKLFDKDEGKFIIK